MDLFLQKRHRRLVRHLMQNSLLQLLPFIRGSQTAPLYAPHRLLADKLYLSVFVSDRCPHHQQNYHRRLLRLKVTHQG